MAASERSPVTFNEALQWLHEGDVAEQSSHPLLNKHSPSPPPVPDSYPPSDEDSTPLPSTSSSFKLTHSRHSKKVQLKRVKALLCISRAEGHCPLSSLLSLTPTAAVYIHGAGASCGMKYDDVYSAFSVFGSISSLTMAGFLPFALLVFDSTDSAVHCRRCHHQQKRPSVCDGRLLFVEYANVSSSTLLQDNPALLLPNASSTQRHSVPGLLVLEDFISEVEEAELSAFLQTQAWLSYKFRSVQHYGYHFDYERCDVFHQMRAHRDRVDEADDLHMFPPVFHALVRRFRDLPSHPSIAPHAPSDCAEWEFFPNQLTVNRYVPGDGIPAHVDVHSSFTSFVLSLSLSSPITMDILPFPPAPGEAASESFTLLLPRRSLLVLGHYARYGCQHAIQQRKTDRVDGRLVERRERVSLTFRRRRESGECNCQWKELCDSASGVRKKDRKFAPAVRQENGGVTRDEEMPTTRAEAEAVGADNGSAHAVSDG